MTPLIQEDPDGMLYLCGTAAEALILRCGFLGKFRHTEEFATQSVIYTEHPTHYLLAQRVTGHPDPEENGYSTFCCSKKRYPHTIFEAMAMLIIEQRGGSLQRSEGFGGAARS